MQVRKLHRKQSIKSFMKQTSTEARNIPLEKQFRIYSQPEKGDVKLEGETLEKVWGEPEKILQGFSKPWVATARNPADS